MVGAKFLSYVSHTTMPSAASWSSGLWLHPPLACFCTASTIQITAKPWALHACARTSQPFPHPSPPPSLPSPLSSPVTVTLGRTSVAPVGLVVLVAASGSWDVFVTTATHQLHLISVNGTSPATGSGAPLAVPVCGHGAGVAPDFRDGYCSTVARFSSPSDMVATSVLSPAASIELLVGSVLRLVDCAWRCAVYEGELAATKRKLHAALWSSWRVCACAAGFFVCWWVLPYRLRTQATTSCVCLAQAAAPCERWSPLVCRCKPPQPSPWPLVAPMRYVHAAMCSMR
jgi:hypothetical protein